MQNGEEEEAMVEEEEEEQEDEEEDGDQDEEVVDDRGERWRRGGREEGGRRGRERERALSVAEFLAPPSQDDHKGSSLPLLPEGCYLVAMQPRRGAAFPCTLTTPTAVAVATTLTPAAAGLPSRRDIPGDAKG